MTASGQRIDQQASRPRAGRSVAFAILLACLAARPFIAELPFGSSMVRMAAAQAGDEPGGPAVTSDRSELARVTFAVALLAAGMVWLFSGALAGRLTVRNAGSRPLFNALGSSWKRSGMMTQGWKRRLLNFASSMETEAIKAKCPPCQRRWRKVRQAFGAFQLKP